MLILPNAEILRADTPPRLDRAGFGDDKRCTASGTAAEVYQVPIVGEAVIARILAHGRDGDAIAERNAANGERHEKVRLNCHKVRTIYYLLQWALIPM